MLIVVNAGSFLVTVGYQGVTEIHRIDYIMGYENDVPKVLMQDHILLEHFDPYIAYQIAVRMADFLGIPYVMKGN